MAWQMLHSVTPLSVFSIQDGLATAVQLVRGHDNLLLTLQSVCRSLRGANNSQAVREEDYVGK